MIGANVNDEEEINLEKAWQAARNVAYSAGEILKEWWPRAKSVKQKGINDIVTNVDMESEKHIRGEIAAYFPEHGIFGEEESGDDPQRGYVWIIDPVDGTRNYAWGIPFFSLVIALAKDGEIITGVNYDPLHDEMFHAAKGKGAYLNEKEIKVSRTECLEGSILGMDLAYEDEKGTIDMLSAVTKLWPRLKTTRIMGSSALGLSYVAAGRTDIYFHHQLQPYDQAAGLLLVEEAGGIVTDRQGIRAGLYSDGIIASCSSLHEAFMKETKSFSWRTNSNNCKRISR